MERDNSLPAKPRCHEKLVWDWQTFAMIAIFLENSFLFLGVTKIKKKVRELLAPSLKLTTLFTVPVKGPDREKKETKSVSHQNIMARRVAIFTLVHEVS